MVRIDPVHDGSESLGFVLGQWPEGSPDGNPTGLATLVLGHYVSHFAVSSVSGESLLIASVSDS